MASFSYLLFPCGLSMYLSIREFLLPATITVPHDAAYISLFSIISRYIIRLGHFDLVYRNRDLIYNNRDPGYRDRYISYSNRDLVYRNRDLGYVIVTLVTVIVIPITVMVTSFTVIVTLVTVVGYFKSRNKCLDTTLPLCVVKCDRVQTMHI